MWELMVCRWRVYFRQGNVEVWVDINDFGLELLSGGKHGEKRLLTAGYVRVGDDYSRARDKKSRTRLVEPFQVSFGAQHLRTKAHAEGWRLYLIHLQRPRP